LRDIDKVIAALSSPVRREILGLIWDRELPPRHHQQRGTPSAPTSAPLLTFGFTTSSR